MPMCQLIQFATVMCVKAQFIGPRKFCHYNMFNHYFFAGDASRSVYFQFLKNSSRQNAGNVLVVIDPPFGGHVTVIAFVLQCITDDYKNMCQGIRAFSYHTTLLHIQFSVYMFSALVKLSFGGR